MTEEILYNQRDTDKLLEQFLQKLEDLVLRSPEAQADGWVLLGIKRRGDVLAERLRKRVEQRAGRQLPLGAMDITLYRDDYSPDKPQPTLLTSEIPFVIDRANVLLIDDVFQTGRTIRAALSQLADFGRPRRVVLAVFVERQLRELPIRPDLCGVQVDRPPGERVQLRLQELDGRDEIVAVRKS